jgi:hypothetical protein
VRHHRADKLVLTVSESLCIAPVQEEIVWMGRRFVYIELTKCFDDVSSK